MLGYYSDWYRARGPMYLNTRLSPPFCGMVTEFVSLKTNILYHTEHTLSNFWFYDPVM